MKQHPVYLLEPVFHWLDELIREHGDQLYMALVYLSVPLIVWILRRGLRRKDSVREAHTSIIIIHVPVRQPPPPPLPFQRKGDLASDDDEDSFAA